MPLKPDLVYPGLDDFVDMNESVIEKPTVESNEPKTTRKENGALIIKDWVSESEEENEPKEMQLRPEHVGFETKAQNFNRVSETMVINGNPQQDLKDKGVIDSECSRHMTGNRSYLTDYEEIDGGFVSFGGNSKGGKFCKGKKD
ncbi:hypothetical protein Tco_0277593 [Tanacetum coccineum]